MLQRIAMLLVLVSLVPAGACKNKSDQPKAAAQPTASGDGAEPTVAVPATPSTPPVAEIKPTATLLSPGAEPRAVLKLALAPNVTQNFAMEMDTEMTMSGQAMVMPTMVMTGKSTITEVAADGTAKMVQTIDSFSAKERTGAMVPAAALTEQLKVIGAMTIRADLLPSGTSRNIAIETSATMPPAMAQMTDGIKQSIENMLPQLPAEPVGIGAKWQVTQSVKQNGVLVNSTNTFELVALKGSVATVRGTQAITAPPQTITQNGQTVELKSLSGQGTQELEIDLTKALPTGKVVVAMKMDLGMQMDVTMSMKLSEK